MFNHRCVQDGSKQPKTSEAEVKADAEAEAEAKAKDKAEAEAKFEVEASAKAKAEAEAKAGAEAKAKAGSSVGGKKALVIGMSYKRSKNNRLKNTLNDANDIHNELTKHGCVSTLITNDMNKVDINKMEEATLKFYDSIKENDTAVFFFAGHGSEYKNEVAAP